MVSAPPLPSRAWLMVALLWLVACLNYLDRVMLTTMRESVVHAIPMTEAQFGLLTSVFLWVYAALSPIAGFLADRFSRSRIIIWSLLAWSLLTWLTGEAKSFEHLIIVRALMGISEAFYLPAALALITDYHRGQTRSLAVGIHNSGIVVGSGIAGIGGVIAERWSWSDAFHIFGIIGIIYGLLILALLRDAPPTPPPPNQPTRSEAPVKALPAIASLFSIPSFWLLILFWSLVGFAGWGVVGWMPTYLAETFDLGQGAAGLSATGYLNIASILGVITGGFLADRWSRRNQRAPILVPAIALLFAAPGILLSGSSSLLVLAITGLVAYGFFRSFTDANMMPILCLVTDSRYRATAYGVLNFFAVAVGGLTIYIGGVLRDSQFDVGIIFQCAAGGLILCAILLYLVRPQAELE